MDIATLKKTMSGHNGGRGGSGVTQENQEHGYVNQA
jgi:hypothetical protein